MKIWTWFRVCVASLLLGSIGCSKSDQAHEHTRNAGQPLTNTEALSLTLPVGHLLISLALGASDRVTISDRSQVRGSPQSPESDATVANAGSNEVTIGADARTRDIVSFGPVVLRERAIVGDVTTTGAVTQQNGVATGIVESGASLPQPLHLSRNFDFAGGADVHVPPDSPALALPPNSYGHVSLHSRSILELSGAGEGGARTYYFESLSIEPGATLRIPNGEPALLLVRGTFDFKGTLDFSGQAGDLFFGLFGTASISLENVLVGTVVAPNATLRFAPAHRSFEGSWFAKAIEVEADVTLSAAPFAHWGLVFPPSPLVICILQTGPDQFSALFGYENRVPDVIEVPLGAGNFLEPLPATPDREPPTIFQPGRVEHGFWSSLVGTEGAWNLGGQRAAASASSTPCDVDAFPEPIASPEPRGEHPAPPLGRSTRLARYFIDPDFEPTGVRALAQILEPTGSASASETESTLNQSLVLAAAGTQLGMRLRFTHLQRMTAHLRTINQTIRLKVTIDGQEFDPRWIYACDSIPECQQEVDVFIPLPVPPSYSVPISGASPAQIIVEMLDDAFPTPGYEEVPLRLHMTVDRQTGEFSGTFRAGETYSIPWTTLGTINPDTPCVSTSTFNGWGLCWNVEVLGAPRLCPTWNADYVDSGFGETITGLPNFRSGQGDFVRAYRARHAAYRLTAWTSPTLSTDFSGFLDEEGCVDVPSHLYSTGVPPVALELELSTEFLHPDGANYVFDRPESIVFTTENGGIPTAALHSPREFFLLSPTLTPTTQIAAAITRLLVTEDMSIPPGTYPVKYGRTDCRFTLGGIQNDESCVSGGELQIGRATAEPTPTPCSSDTDCIVQQQCYEAVGSDFCRSGVGCVCKWPDQSRWKYVVLHEAGHQIQDRAMGLLGSAYTFSCPSGMDCSRFRQSSLFSGWIDPPVDMDPLCRCDHVEAANAEHCLQSIERSWSAQNEGFAHFIAAKAWNRQDTGECTFVYYKEHLEPGALPELPPVAIDCADPVKWRLSHCPMSTSGDMSTERDWLAFFWALNTQGASEGSTLDDIFLIYRHACNPSDPASIDPNPDVCSNRPRIAWQARPARPAPGNRSCRSTDQCDSVPPDQFCADASPGSTTPCSSLISDCVCKLPEIGGVREGALLHYVADLERLNYLLDTGASYGVATDSP